MEQTTYPKAADRVVAGPGLSLEQVLSSPLRRYRSSVLANCTGQGGSSLAAGIGGTAGFWGCGGGLWVLSESSRWVRIAATAVAGGCRRAFPCTQVPSATRDGSPAGVCRRCGVPLSAPAFLRSRVAPVRRRHAPRPRFCAVGDVTQVLLGVGRGLTLATAQTGEGELTTAAGAEAVFPSLLSSSHTCTMWRSLATEPTLTSQILEQLLEKVNRDVPYKESKCFLLGSGSERIATPLPLAVSVARPVLPRSHPHGGWHSPHRHLERFFHFLGSGFCARRGLWK